MWCYRYVTFGLSTLCDVFMISYRISLYRLIFQHPDKKWCKFWLMYGHKILIFIFEKFIRNFVTSQTFADLSCIRIVSRICVAVVLLLGAIAPAAASAGWHFCIVFVSSCSVFF